VKRVAAQTGAKDKRMRRRSVVVASLVAMTAGSAAAGARAQQPTRAADPPRIVELHIDGEIEPVMAEA